MSGAALRSLSASNSMHAELLALPNASAIDLDGKGFASAVVDVVSSSYGLVEGNSCGGGDRVRFNAFVREMHFAVDMHVVKGHDLFLSVFE